MKKNIMILTCAALLSLACLQTAVLQTAAPGTPSAIPSVTEAATSTQEPTATAQACAVVTASEALNVRAQPNEHGNILGWLAADDVIRVEDAAGEWWLVSADPSLTGYVRAAYLARRECE
jgi:uncharacterized protein YgiM (DUF1202 family)